MRAQKRSTEIVIYSISTFLTAAGTALCLAGLLLPNWYSLPLLDGDQVVGEAKLGLWQDEICQYNSTCMSYWLSDESARPSNLVLPYWKLILGLETAGCATAALSLMLLIPLWIFLRSNVKCIRHLTFYLFLVTSLIAGFLCIIGCLVVTSKTDRDKVGFASLLSGIGGSVIFISVCLAIVVCRYDPTYGTLENPVSPKFSHA